MERFTLEKLLKWKNSPYRKPLILKGVRQVGKTWILKEFGRRYYDNTAYFNFDEHEEYKQFFETTKDVDRILQNLMLASGQKIIPEKTLIILNRTPFVRQYDILSNRWGDLLCQEENQTNDTRRNSRSWS